jgi:hypothetical protein
VLWSKAPMMQQPQQEETGFDWDARLSIAMIRDHTKTSDIPGVSDEQLMLYRSAAIDAAERYTGLLLAGQRTVTEPIEAPRPRPGKATFHYKLKHPVADGIVSLYGSDNPAANRVFQVPPGSREIQIPIGGSGYFLPYLADRANDGMMVTYKTGFACAADIPSGIILGCLQYCAWTIEHPGDELLTQRGGIENTSKSMGGSSNNIALVSGAIESWRIFADDEF